MELENKVVYLNQEEGEKEEMEETIPSEPGVTTPKEDTEGDVSTGGPDTEEGLSEDETSREEEM